MEEIIIRYLQNDATAEEKILLETWLKESKNNQDEFESFKKTWDLTSRLNRIHSVNVISARKKMKRNIPEFKKSKSFFFYWQRIAAIIILPLMILVAGYFYYLSQTPGDEIFQQTIQASYGTRNQLNLPDGTEVWLNSGSIIRFPSEFRGNRREVYLEGEAFFNVTDDKLRPFYVNLGEMSVKEGALLPGENAEEIKAIKSVDAEPIKQKVDIFENKYTSWINGKLIFRNDPMDEVVKRLGCWYNVDIQLTETLLYDFRYTATFIDETLEQVLDLLKLSAPIEYTLTERKISDDNSYTKKLVIIR